MMPLDAILDAPPPACLIGLMGLPGAGKSTLAQALSAQRGWPVLSTDAVRAAMFPVYRGSEEENAAAEDGVWAALRASARLGRTTIVEGMMFADPAAREQLHGTAAAFGLRSCLILLDCPLVEAVKRVSRLPRPDRDARRVRQTAARFAPPSAGTWVLDAGEAPEQLLLQVGARLAGLLQPQAVAQPAERGTE